MTSALYAILRSHDVFIEHIHTLERDSDAGVEGVTQNKLAVTAPPEEEAKKIEWILSQEPDVIAMAPVESQQAALKLIEHAKSGKRVYIAIRASSTFEALNYWRKLVGDDRLATRDLRLIINSRILRKLCSACKVGYAPDAPTLRKLGINPERVTALYQARTVPMKDQKGNIVPCNFCQELRFKGRVGVYETLMMDDEMRETVAAGKSPSGAFRKQRGKYLQEEALALVEKGETSVQEVLRSQGRPCTQQGYGGKGGGKNMILLIIALLCVLGIAYFHYTQGFFSATLSAILTIICAVFALSFDETLLERLLAGKMANYAHGMMLLLLFAGSYSILRQIFDKCVPGQMRLPVLVDRIGGAVMGIVAGAFATGIVMIAAQEFPFGPTFMGYSRYSVNDDHDEVLAMPGRQQSKSYHVYDELKSDEPGVFDDSMKHTLFVDDLVVNTTAYLSNGGSLAGDQPLTRMHPDFLTELFGQRLGIEPGGRSVAMNNPSKGLNDVSVPALFSLPSVAQAESEVPKTRAIYTTKLGQTLKPKPDEILLVVRTVFAHSAADSDALIRVSTGAVHLVAPILKDDGTTGYADYYPLGTMEGDSTLFLNKLDDPLFLDAHGGSVGADFVFLVKKSGFIDTAKMKLLPGAFLDVKRMARRSFRSARQERTDGGSKPGRGHAKDIGAARGRDGDDPDAGSAAQCSRRGGDSCAADSGPGHSNARAGCASSRAARAGHRNPLPTGGRG